MVIRVIVLCNITFFIWLYRNYKYAIIYNKWYCKYYTLIIIVLTIIKLCHDDAFKRMGYSGVSINPCLVEAMGNLETTLI